MDDPFALIIAAVILLMGAALFLAFAVGLFAITVGEFQRWRQNGWRGHLIGAVFSGCVLVAMLAAAGFSIWSIATQWPGGN